MNLRSVVLLLGGLSVSLAGAGQELAGKAGTGVAEYRYGNPIKPLEAGPDGIYACLSKHSEATLVHYLPDGNFDWKKRITAPTVDIEQKKVPTEIIAVHRLQDKWYLLCNATDSRTSESRLYAFSYNKQGEAGTEPALLDQYRGSLYQDVRYTFRLAADSASLLAIRANYMKDSEPAAYTLTLVGPALNRIWQREIKYTKANKLVEFQDAIVDRAHHAYVLTTIDWKKEAVSRHDRYGASFRMAGPETEQIQEMTADMNLKVKNMHASITPSGELRVFGTYTDELEVKEPVMKGVFYLKAKPGTTAFDLAALALFPPELSKEFEKDQAINFYSVDEIHNRSDGSATAVLGNSTIEYTQVGNSYVSRYIEGPLLVVNFDKEGRHSWSKVLRRKQIHGGFGAGEWVGQTSLLHGNTLYVIYTDNLKNASAKDGKTHTWMGGDLGSKTTPAVISIDERGNSREYFPLAAEKESDFMISPSKWLKTGNQLWCFGQGAKKYAVMRLDLP